MPATLTRPVVAPFCQAGEVATTIGGASVTVPDSGFATILDGGFATILDGGFATELERRGHDLSDDLWSARLLRDDPDEIIATHLAFFRAGADVATTASYQASVEGFARHGLSRGAAEELLRDSVRLARIAATLAEAEDGVRRLVAASIGPYGAVLADGSEYHGDYGVSDEFLRDFHGRRMAVLVDAGADLLAIETVPSLQEAAALLAVLEEMPAGTRAWLSLSCADDRLTRRGDDVGEAFALAAPSDRVVAVGVNCTAPEHVTALLTRAVAASGKPAIAYPNSGEGWDARSRSWTGTGAVVDAARAREWVAAGATYVGGCCRVGSADIARLVEELRHDEPT
jgi:homocysteine S-methyltransferase